MIDPLHLNTIPRFAVLTGEAKAWVCEKSSLLQLNSGEPVFLEGDECRFLYIVLQGEVKIYKSLESGREIILNFFHPGEAFGEVAVIDGGNYPANAIVHENATLLRLPRDDYLEMLRVYPEAALSIIRDLSLRMRTLRQRVELLGEAGVQARIAQLLITLASEVGLENDGKVRVPFNLTRSEIADMIGARNETVIRIMSRWNKDGLVTKDEKGFCIGNLDSLSDLLSENS